MRMLYITAVAVLLMAGCSHLPTPRERFLALSQVYETALVTADAYRDNCAEKLAKAPVDKCRAKVEEMQAIQKRLIKVYEGAFNTFLVADKSFYEQAMANLLVALGELNTYLAENRHE